MTTDFLDPAERAWSALERFRAMKALYGTQPLLTFLEVWQDDETMDLVACPRELLTDYLTACLQERPACVVFVGEVTRRAVTRDELAELQERGDTINPDDQRPEDEDGISICAVNGEIAYRVTQIFHVDDLGQLVWEVPEIMDVDCLMDTVADDLRTPWR